MSTSNYITKGFTRMYTRAPVGMDIVEDFHTADPITDVNPPYKKASRITDKKHLTTLL